jgi:hypothetical protein
VHLSTIVTRTAAGSAELALPAHGLSLTQRRFLTLLDMSCSVDELAHRHPTDAARLARDVTRLAQLGLVACDAPIAARGSISPPIAADASIPAPIGANASSPATIGANGSSAATGANASSRAPIVDDTPVAPLAVRLGPSAFAHRLRWFLLPIATGVVAWLAWQHWAAPPTAARGEPVAVDARPQATAHARNAPMTDPSRSQPVYSGARRPSGPVTS